MRNYPKTRASSAIGEIRAAIGKRFGDRVLIGTVEPRLYDIGDGRIAKDHMVLARCDCGDMRGVPWKALKRGDADRCFKCAMKKRDEKKRRP